MSGIYSCHLLVGLLRACELLEPDCLVHMLKAIKHLSMNSNLLDVLQNANAIEILTRILEEHKSGPYSTVRPPFSFVSNYVFTFTYSACSARRKWRTTYSKPVTTSVGSTNSDKKRPPRPASFPVSCVSSSPSHRSSSLRCLYFVISRAQARAVGCFCGNMMGWRCISACWRIRTSKSVLWSRYYHGMPIHPFFALDS